MHPRRHKILAKNLIIPRAYNKLKIYVKMTNSYIIILEPQKSGLIQMITGTR